jgi:hypothetical protein
LCLFLKLSSHPVDAYNWSFLRVGYCKSFTLDNWTGYVNVFWSCIRKPLPRYYVDFLVASYLRYF